MSTQKIISGIESVESQLERWKKILPNITIPPTKAQEPVFVLVDWKALGISFPVAVIRILDAINSQTPSPQVDTWEINTWEDGRPKILPIEKILSPSGYLAKKRATWKENFTCREKCGNEVNIRIASPHCLDSETEEEDYPANILDCLEMIFANPRLHLQEEIVLHGSGYCFGETEYFFSIGQAQSKTFFLGEYRRGRVPHGIKFLNLIKRNP